MKKSLQDPELSIIVPVYNEAVGLRSFHSSLIKVLEKLDTTYEVLYVDDGSRDQSDTVITEIAHGKNNIEPIYLSRNFGKEQATTAGLHQSHGKAAIIIDADGQHPVELIPDFVKKWRGGAQVVIGLRESNQKEGTIKRHGSKLFYHSLKVMGAPDVVSGSTDFRLIDREVIDAFNQLTEHNRITRALIDWLGFNREYVKFHAKAREHGEASYSTRKLVQLALNGFVSLSFTPLFLSGYIGVFITFLSFVLTIFAVIEKYLFDDPFGLNITGTAILAVLIVFLVGILLIGQGLLAVYVARIYTETQGRPLYIKKNN